jgi:hypothetical protein
MQLSYYDKSTRPPVSYVNFVPVPNPPPSPPPNVPPVIVPALKTEEFVIPTVVNNNISGSNNGTSSGSGTNTKSRKSSKKANNNNSSSDLTTAADGTQANATGSGNGNANAANSTSKSTAKSNKRQKTGHSAPSSVPQESTDVTISAVQDGITIEQQDNLDSKEDPSDTSRLNSHAQQPQRHYPATLLGGTKVTSVPVPGSNTSPAVNNTVPAGSTAPVHGNRSNPYVSSYPQQSSVMPSHGYSTHSSPSTVLNSGITSPSGTASVSSSYPQQSFFTATRATSAGSGANLSTVSSQSNTPSHYNNKSTGGNSGNSSANMTSVNVSGSLPYGTYQPVATHPTSSGSVSNNPIPATSVATLQQHHTQQTNQLPFPPHPGLVAHSTSVPSSSSSISSLYKTTQQGGMASTQNVHLYQPVNTASGSSMASSGTFSYYAPSSGASSTSGAYGQTGTAGTVNTYQPVPAYLTTPSTSGSNPGASNLLSNGTVASANLTGTALNNTYHPSVYHPPGTNSNGSNSVVPIPNPGGAPIGSSVSSMNTSSSSPGFPWTSLDDDTLIILKQTTYDYQQITACINKLRAQQKSSPRQMQEIVQRYEFLNSTGRVSERLKDQTVINMVAKIQRGATSSIINPTSTSTGTLSTSTSALPVTSGSTGTTGYGSTGLSSTPMYTTSSSTNVHSVYPVTSSLSTVSTSGTMLPSGFVKTVVPTSSGSNSSVQVSNLNIYQPQTAPSASLLNGGTTGASSLLANPGTTSTIAGGTTVSTVFSHSGSTEASPLHVQYYQQQQNMPANTNNNPIVPTTSVGSSDTAATLVPSVSTTIVTPVVLSSTASTENGSGHSSTISNTSKH